MNKCGLFVILGIFANSSFCQESSDNEIYSYSAANASNWSEYKKDNLKTLFYWLRKHPSSNRTAKANTNDDEKVPDFESVTTGVVPDEVETPIFDWTTDEIKNHSFVVSSEDGVKYYDDEEYDKFTSIEMNDDRNYNFELGDTPYEETAKEIRTAQSSPDWNQLDTVTDESSTDASQFTTFIVQTTDSHQFNRSETAQSSTDWDQLDTSTVEGSTDASQFTVSTISSTDADEPCTKTTQSSTNANQFDTTTADGIADSNQLDTSTIVTSCTDADPTTVPTTTDACQFTTSTIQTTDADQQTTTTVQSTTKLDTTTTVESSTDSSQFTVSTIQTTDANQPSTTTTQSSSDTDDTTTVTTSFTDASQFTISTGQTADALEQSTRTDQSTTSADQFDTTTTESSTDASQYGTTSVSQQDELDDEFSEGVMLKTFALLDRGVTEETSKSGILALRNVRILASEAVKVGESMRLICEYDLENALLYSIKWYFNENEFYRFVPKESPPTRVFPLAGIDADMSRSDNKSVTIQSVQRDQTGYYKCEVSADAPLFHTDIKKILIVVTEQPKLLPTIKTDKPKYTEGDIIRANCTSSRGFPAANITWFVNGRKVSTTDDKLFHLVKSPNVSVKSEPNGLETSNSTLEILATSHIFSKGRLKLTCEATQFNIYKKSTELNVIEDVPQLAPVLGPSGPSNASSNLNGKIFNKILHCLALCFTLGSYYFKRR